MQLVTRARSRSVLVHHRRRPQPPHAAPRTPRPSRREATVHGQRLRRPRRSTRCATRSPAGRSRSPASPVCSSSNSCQYVQQRSRLGVRRLRHRRQRLQLPVLGPARFDRSIDLMVDALLAKGVKRVFWVTLREVKPAFYSDWNRLSRRRTSMLYQRLPVRQRPAARRATLRHPRALDHRLGVASPISTGITYDAIHLNPNGAAMYAGLAPATVLNAPPPGAGAAPSPSHPGGGRAGVPADATAVSLNLTAVHPRTAGYLTVYPCGGELPMVSNLNYRACADRGQRRHRAGRRRRQGVRVPERATRTCWSTSTAHSAPDSGFIPLPPRARHRHPQSAASIRRPDRPGASRLAPRRTRRCVHRGGQPHRRRQRRRPTLRSLHLRHRTVASPRRARWRPGSRRTSTMVVATDANGDVCVGHQRHCTSWSICSVRSRPRPTVHPMSTQRILDTGSPAASSSRSADRPVQVAGLAGVPVTRCPPGRCSPSPCVAPEQRLRHGVPVLGRRHTARPCSTCVPNHAQTNAVIVGLDAAGTVCVHSSVTTQAPSTSRAGPAPRSCRSRPLGSSTHDSCSATAGYPW